MAIAKPPSLRVADNQRFLVTENGAPFFYLGDTAWELFHRLDRDEAAHYLDVRSKQGFTVIQAVALAEFDGLSKPNANGHLPLVANDPAQPLSKEGPNNDYWDHVDAIVSMANDRGLVVGFLPTWGDKWNQKWGVGPEIFTPQNARQYGQWLGARYRDAGLIWILGGDRPIENETHREIVTAMAQGLREGDGGAHLMTYHPMGGMGSSEWFHEADWLDFNMRQNGHVNEYTGRYDQTRVDYNRDPAKPVIDAEPIYEGHPVAFNANEFGHSISADVRRPLYWDLFGGACGHTYGHHSVWQFWTAEREPVNNPLVPWREAIESAASHQMVHARRLLESRPFLTRIPDDEVIVTDRVPTSVPGAGRYRFVATRDEERSFAMIYAPMGRPFRVRNDAVSGTEWATWWFNPRDGSAKRFSTTREGEMTEFRPLDDGEYLDWVLVIDDASRQYPPPGW